MIVNSKHRKWLEHIALASKGKGGMYLGERVDLIPPKVLRALDAAGYLSWVMPHNPAHKERVVITTLGLSALMEASE